MIFPHAPVRADDTLGPVVGKVTRIKGTSCYYSVDAGYERGPAAIPEDMRLADTVIGGDFTTVTPNPLRVGQKVAVLATTAGQYVLARY